MATLSSLEKLELLKAKFSNWRKQKRAGEKIPIRLLHEAFDLCKSLKYSKVSKTLGMGNGDFKKRLMLYNSSHQLVKQEPAKPFFHEVDALSVKAIFSSQAVEIISPTGHVLRLPSINPLQAIEVFMKS